MEYTWSSNCENFIHEIFDSVEECILDAIREGGYDVIYVGEIERPNLDFSSFGDSISDNIYEQLCDQVGSDWAETFNPRKEEIADLDLNIEKVVSNWMYKIKEPSCFKIINIKQYTLK